MVVPLRGAPPLITGTVPTAEVGHCEVYLGTRYQKTSYIQRQFPHVELVYGITPRWEVSCDTNYLIRNERRGADDLAVATKVVVLPESARLPGLAVSYDYKSDNGDAAQGLGTGGIEHELRLRTQKGFGFFTPIINAGRVFVPDVEIAGTREARRDVWRASCAQEWTISSRLKLLSEVYWRTTDEPGGPARLGWNIGFKHRVHDGVSWHAAIGESLRKNDRGGPKLRVYAGVKYEFAAPRTAKKTP